MACGGRIPPTKLFGGESPSELRNAIREGGPRGRRDGGTAEPLKGLTNNTTPGGEDESFHLLFICNHAWTPIFQISEVFCKISSFNVIRISWLADAGIP